ncbi:hypothetical protein HAX54_017045 [Datura stramonium]|uniref:Uncharacterized protein n=1 Tax=Datura stramonium TaxID=4076 RepID=A0ABS8ULK2_DATST|nr:hypothetical protein [Datura stramonium]
MDEVNENGILFGDQSLRFKKYELDEFGRIAKLPEEDFGGRILPVYVFDLDVSSILLLDRYHQSVAFKDMVIAVRTKSTQTVSMWGVSPTRAVWSPRHNSTLVDYSWSVGQTPFGPFSDVSSLSFVQKDAARRNVLLTSLNFSITSALEVLESISAHGGERKLLKHNQLTEFMQRWNLFKYKLDKAVSALSHFDFEMALYHLRASES